MSRSDAILCLACLRGHGPLALMGCADELHFALQAMTPWTFTQLVLVPDLTGSPSLHMVLAASEARSWSAALIQEFCYAAKAADFGARQTSLRTMMGPIAGCPVGKGDDRRCPSCSICQSADGGRRDPVPIEGQCPTLSRIPISSPPASLPRGVHWPHLRRARHSRRTSPARSWRVSSAS